jgi:pyruvate kinase
VAPARKTKIIGTIGPASSEQSTLDRLVEAGLDTVRLNCGHLDHAGLRRHVAAVREAAERSGRPVATLLDLGGPKVRTGDLVEGSMRLVAGRPLRIVPGSGPSAGDRITSNHPGLAGDVRTGDAVLLDDGAMELRIQRVDRESVIHTEVVTGGVLRPRKGLNVPSRSMSLPALTERDRLDLAVGLEAGVDFVALSFVQSGRDLRLLKDEMSRLGSTAPTLAKIERPQAVEDLDAILAESDGILVARGDLAVEVGNSRVPMLQKSLLRRACRAGCLGIVATQMLESMTHRLQPSRAEVSDVANAILDGASALTLSDETATGRHPVEAVSVIDRIARDTEPWTGACEELHIAASAGPHITMAVVRAAAAMAADPRFKALIVFTLSGRTARLLGGYLPAAPILALTPDPRTVRALALHRGVVPVCMPLPDNSDEMVLAGERELVRRGLLAPGDEAIVVAGFLRLPGVANMVKVVRV